MLSNYTSLKLLFHYHQTIERFLNILYILFLAGSAGAILLDIDKVMIPGKEEIALAA